jgi:regulator of protease activity HflC (stomatin/prohibitin superfamily)
MSKPGSAEEKPAQVGSMSLDYFLNSTDEKPKSSTKEELEDELKNTITPKPEEEKDEDDESQNTPPKGDEELGEDEEENDSPEGGKTPPIDNKGKETEMSKVYLGILEGVFGDDFKDVVLDVEGQDVSLKDANLDLDTVKELIETRMQEIKESEAKDKISLDKVSEFTKALIEIEKNGGDISKILHAKKDFGDPLKTIDLNTPEGLKEAIRLRLKAEGQTEDRIKRIIRSYEVDEILEEEGHRAYEELEAAIDNQIQLGVEESKKEAERQKELMKQFRKNIKDELSVFQLKDTVKSKIVDLATKEDPEGGFVLDNLFQQWRIDPKKAARLTLFLLDEEEFIKQVTTGEVTKAKLESAKKRYTVKTETGSSSSAGTPERKNKAASIPLDTLRSM